MLSLDNLKTFFKRFLKNNAVFKDYNLYEIIADFLIDYYFKHSAESIPYNHKLAFENNIIPDDWYDIILISNGFPSELIKSFTIREKYILLSSFMDFNKYKGSIDQIFKVAYSFDEKLCLYELFLDYRIRSVGNQTFTFTNDSNVVKCYDELAFIRVKVNDWIYPNGADRTIARQIIRKDVIDGEYLLTLDENYLNDDGDGDFYINYERWYFIPYLIYKHPEMENRVIEEELEFHIIEPYVNSFLITKEYLDEIRLRNDVVLPIKTNLIFLDYGNYHDVNPLYNLFATIILREIQNEKMIIYFKDSEYRSSILNMYKLWFYILYKYNMTNFKHDLDMDLEYIVFSINDPDLNYKISNIDELLTEYDNIKTNKQLDDFFQTKIKNNFLTKNNIDFEINHEDLYAFYEKDLTKELLDYLDTRINATPNRKLEINFILDEIYNSIITWSIAYEDENLSKHLYYFLNNLTKISFRINESPTYKMIEFLKPFHTEITYQFSDLLKIKDKFNSIYLDESYYNNILLNYTSILNYGMNILFYLNQPTSDTIDVISSNQLYLTLKKYSSIYLEDHFNFLIKVFFEGDFVISDVVNNMIKYKDYSHGVINDEILLGVSELAYDDISPADSFRFLSKMFYEGIVNIQDDCSYGLKIISNSSSDVINDEILLGVTELAYDDISLTDSFGFLSKMIYEGIINIQDDCSFGLKIINNSSSFYTDHVTIKKHYLLRDESGNFIVDGNNSNIISYSETIL